MRLTIFFFLFFSSALFASGQEKGNITTFILVRHAEKASDGSADPALLPAGEDRAKRLADMLRNTEINSIYSTKFNRTKSTVKPLADSKGLGVEIYETLKAEELEGLIRKYNGGTIVIAGHSNTIPAIANLLTGKETYSTFSDNEYGNLIIVSVVTLGKNAKATRLTY